MLFPGFAKFNYKELHVKMSESNPNNNTPVADAGGPIKPYMYYVVIAIIVGVAIKALLGY